MLAESRHSPSLSPRANCVQKIECSSRALSADSGHPPTGTAEPALPWPGCIFHDSTEEMTKIRNDLKSNSKANTYSASTIYHFRTGRIVRFAR